jgi:hypothetical protein
MGRDFIAGVSRLRFIAFALFATNVLRRVQGFEVFSEQQILKLHDPTRAIDYNNTEYGSTYVEDYWAKLDINYSPLEGFALYKHVYIGCYEVNWLGAPASSYAEWTDHAMADLDCVAYCNHSMAYFKTPDCRCAYNETDLYMADTTGSCSEDAWSVYREYDYRSSMSPATYDVARRILYQVVTLRIPHVSDPLRYYIHAVNAMEAKPKFDFDTQLDRMIFNAVWDFGRTGKRMVALSFRDWGRPLDFTIVSLNASSGSLVVTQKHYPLEGQITTEGSLLSSWASCDGLSTVDILWATYYTVVPAQIGLDPVHVVVAIDIERKRVLNAIRLPVTLMNMQLNALTHVLYGAGADLFRRSVYYELCGANNVTELDPDSGVVRVVIEVTCGMKEMGELPAAVNYMYLQSATMDHIYNYAWMTYKTEPTERPLVLEYHMNEKDENNNVEYKAWREESLPLEAMYTSLIQTAPRIIFALYPPIIKYAKFSSSGTKIFVQFESPTLAVQFHRT